MSRAHAGFGFVSLEGISDEAISVPVFFAFYRVLAQLLSSFRSGQSLSALCVSNSRYAVSGARGTHSVPAHAGLFDQQLSHLSLVGSGG